METKLTVMTEEEQKEKQYIIAELEEKLDGMKQDKEAKCKAAKEQLIEMLSVTADKYLTATGTAEALRVVRFATGDTPGADQLRIANIIAHAMSDEALAMATKASELPYSSMDSLCDEFYEKDFVVEESMTYDEKCTDLAFEMMRIDLCRNVGGAAEDMVSFVKRAQEEIDAVGEELKKERMKPVVVLDKED